jgi:hypothetical protein
MEYYSAIERKSIHTTKSLDRKECEEVVMDVSSLE